MYLIYLCYFATEGVLYPFWQTWLKSLGYGHSDIATFVAASYWPQVFVGLALTYLADWRFSQLWLAGLAALLSTLCVAAFYLPKNMAVYLVLAVAYGGLWAAVLPLGEAYLLAHERFASYDYGRVRAAGSLAFIILSVGGGGMFAVFGQRLVPAVVAVLMLTTGLVCLFLAGGLHRPNLAKPAVHARRPAMPDWRPLRHKPTLLLAIAAAGLIQLSHCLYYFTASNIWSARGYSSVSIGLFWAVAVIAEIVFFAYSGTILRSIPPLTVMIASGMFAALRWAVFGIDAGIPLIVVVQIMHALSFAAYHAALMRYIRDDAPASVRNLTQGLYYSLVVALPMGIITPIAGRLFDAAPFYAYALMVAFALAGTATAQVARGRSWAK